MKILVCGSRHWDDDVMIFNFLRRITSRDPKETYLIIHGAQEGADMLADAAARKLGLPRRPVPADWTWLGKAAGPARNRRMLSMKPDLVVAFKDHLDPTLTSGGTEDMLRIARDSGIVCIHKSHFPTHPEFQ